jgi:hypothetical protein
MRYSLAQGSADSVPVSSSFSPQPPVYPRPLFRLATCHPLPTFPRFLFSYTYELPLPTDRFASPLFSWSYKLLFPQTLCFDNHLRCPLFFGSVLSLPVRQADLCTEGSLTPFPASHTKNVPITPFAATHTKMPSRKPFPCHTYKKAGGWGA